jgi:hypothetical protein
MASCKALSVSQTTCNKKHRLPLIDASVPRASSLPASGSGSDRQAIASVALSPTTKPTINHLKRYSATIHGLGGGSLIAITSLMLTELLFGADALSYPIPYFREEPNLELH